MLVYHNLKSIYFKNRDNSNIFSLNIVAFNIVTKDCNDI